MRKENKKLKDYMNKKTPGIFDQYLNNNKQLVMMKARRTGMSSSLLMNWKKIYNKYERKILRKESIKRIFNI